MKIFVTGSSGFVGTRVVKLAQQQGITCLEQRSLRGEDIDNSSVFRADLTESTDWMPALRDVDVIVHCAARVHQMSDKQGALALYRQTNVAGTLRLARQASEAGVKRFIFISSVKVNGESTPFGQPFLPEVIIPPADPYALSKFEAEQGLLALSRETGLEVVIIRPPLVYGPGVKANFQAMMRWVMRGVPLPLAAVDNRRSLVFVDNLVSLVLLCLDNPQAVGKVWMVSDDHDVSTATLLADMARALGVRNRSWRCPVSLLRCAATIVGKGAMVERLVGSLQVDVSDTRQCLGWQPAIPYHQAMSITARALLAQSGDAKKR
ncbi:UDP-glucose 4-epimerase family protein [Dickeya aquatica]|uniref:UDP-glucose 4-epimerase family protein n=1 Tax=Dickeya aquatica TaxID=1401087 RepID=UPI0015D9C1A2|nr:SDR family oxidoreductase [Dickeya aquatica]